MEYVCANCGWEGPKSKLGKSLTLIGAKDEFCPTCGKADFLVNETELEEIVFHQTKGEGTCLPQRLLNNPTSS
ncbi:hypothetical protein DFP76_104225 [Marinomonas aquiplantarum]|uniref:Uncharacterized protein n=1 Tax=Marinomonas aquiplantarum TaxID=491951 RepID=A0A366D011_9GAMM|nr:hypothetical protein DFP76_104225 [Marinomonas aquiplantarum]